MVWYDSEIWANWFSIRSKTLDSFSLVYLKIFGILYAQAIQVLRLFFKEVFRIFIQDIFSFDLWNMDTTLLSSQGKYTRIPLMDDLSSFFYFSKQRFFKGFIRRIFFQGTIYDPESYFSSDSNWILKLKDWMVLENKLNDEKSS